MMTRMIGSLVLLVFHLLAAATLPAAAGDETLPPADLVSGNLEQCEAAVELLVTGVVEAERYGDDAGGSGYVQYLVRGTVTRSFKGRLREKDEISYRFTQEQGPDGRAAVSAGARYVVFLKKDADDGGYWLIAEAAQFESSPGLIELLPPMEPAE